MRLPSEKENQVLVTLIASENTALSATDLVRKADISASTWKKYSVDLENSGLVTIQDKRELYARGIKWYREVKLTKRGMLIALRLVSIGQLMELPQN